MTNLFPTQIQRADSQQLIINWSDGQSRKYTVRDLRDHCPCATCRETHGAPKQGLPILSEAETRPLTVDGMKPVGNYAYSIAFSDGHDSGIFTFELLRDLGEPVT